MPTDQELSKLFRGIEKDLKGTVTIQEVSQLRTAFNYRRPTGLCNMDIKLGNGFPGGSIIQLHGRDGAGKNLIAYLVAAENQRIYGDESMIFIVSFGYRPDVSQMRLCGMQIALTDQELEEQGLDPLTATAEQRGTTPGKLFILGETDEADGAPAEALFETITHIAASGWFQIGIIDEMGSGETKDTVIKKFHEHVKVATWASLVTRFIQRLYTLYRRPLPNGEPLALTLFVLNPARANIAGAARARPGFTPPDLQTSGFALKHAKAVDLHIRGAGTIRVKGKKVGKTVGYKVAKGKNGIEEGIEGEFVWHFTDGVDLEEDLVQAAKAWDLIHKRKGVWYCMDIDVPLCRRQDEIPVAMKDLFADMPGLFSDLKEQTIEVALEDPEEGEEVVEE